MSTILEKNRIQRSINRALKKAQQSGKLPVEAQTLIALNEKETVDITPKRGVDYFTQEDVNEIVSVVLAQIPKPKNGKAGVDGTSPIAGKDYPTKEQVSNEVKRLVNRITIPVPQDGKTPIKGIDYFTAEETESLKSDIIEALSPLFANLEETLQQKIDKKPSLSLFSGKKGGGGNSSKYRTITSSATMQSNDVIIFADASSGDVTVTLPSTSSAARREYHIKKIDTSVNIVRIMPQSGTIDGEVCQDITNQYTSRRVYSTGTNWFII